MSNQAKECSRFLFTDSINRPIVGSLNTSNRNLQVPTLLLASLKSM